MSPFVCFHGHSTFLTSLRILQCCWSVVVLPACSLLRAPAPSCLFSLLSIRGAFLQSLGIFGQIILILWVRHQKSRVDTLCHGRSVFTGRFHAAVKGGISKCQNLSICTSFSVSTMKDPQVLRQMFLLGCQYPGRQQDQGWWPSPSSVCGPSVNFNFLGKGNRLEEGARVHSLYNPSSLFSPNCTPALNAAWWLPLPEPFQGSCSTNGRNLHLTSFYRVRTHSCRDFLLFGKNADFSCRLLPLILFILGGLYLSPSLCHFHHT